MNIIFKCSKKLFKILEKIREEKNKEYHSDISDIIEESLLSYYDIKLTDLNDHIESSYIKLTDDESSSYDLKSENDYNNYVYVYLDPNSKGDYIFDEYHFEYKPFYVGKGKCERMNSHHGKKNNQKMKDKMTFLKKNNCVPIILIIKDGLSNLEAHSLENRLIRLIYDEINDELCNVLIPLNKKINKNIISDMNLEIHKNKFIKDCLKSSKKIKDISKELGISERTLYRKMKELGINRNKRNIN